MTLNLTSIFILIVLIPSTLISQTIDNTWSERNKPGFLMNNGQLHDQDGRSRKDIIYYTEVDGLSLFIGSSGFSYQGIEAITSLADTNYSQVNFSRVDIEWIGNNRMTLKSKTRQRGIKKFYSKISPVGTYEAFSYNSIVAENIFDRINLEWYYSENNQLEYDFVVWPGGDPSEIKWCVRGPDSIYIDQMGNLTMDLGELKIIEKAPIAFQEDRTIKANWLIQDSVISLEIAAYDTNRTLRIDPIIRSWGSYYGGLGDEMARDITTDDQGNIYMVGQSSSTSTIATTGAHQINFSGGSYDGFITKFNQSGTRLWSTYYGGSGNDVLTGCSASNSWEIYVSGYSTSTSGISTVGSHQESLVGPSDAFLVKFDSSGTRIWGTYFGGNGSELGNDCSFTAEGGTYICGRTYSDSALATSGSHQESFGGPTSLGDGFLARFNQEGVLLWATYYGGQEGDYSNSVSSDNLGFVYMIGTTHSSNNISTIGSHQDSIGGTPSPDVYLVKFDSNGNRQWATYYGAWPNDYGEAVVVDSSYNIYISGYTLSQTHISTPGCFQYQWGSGWDIFLAKFDSSGTRDWGTYLSGASNPGLYSDYSFGLAIDNEQNIYLGGRSADFNKITSYGAYQKEKQGLHDALLAKFSPSGQRYWCTLYGGTDWDYGLGVAVSSSNEVYLCGYTESDSALSSSNGHQENFGGGTFDAFLVKFEQCQNLTNDTVTIHSCDSFVSPSGNYTWYQSGFYSEPLTSSEGCDSTAFFDLTIHGPTDSVVTVTACNSYNWVQTGSNYSVSGYYSDVYTSIAGCDSSISLNLTINVNTIGSFDTSTCGPFTSPSGTIWSQSGAYQDVIPNAAGCDSFIYINLSIDTLEWSIDTITPNSIKLNSNSTAIQWLNCDSSNAIIVGETLLVFSFDQSGEGSFAAAMSLNSCRDTTECFDLIGVGVTEEVGYWDLRLFPNPIEDFVVLEFGQFASNIHIQLFNANGQVSFESFVNDVDRFEIPIQGPSGIYFLHLISKDRDPVVLRVIKE